MYKLRKGVTLPKEFKIKVNADESKALQEYLFSVGNVWNGKIGTQEVKNTELPFMYLENSKLLYDFYESKESFKKDPLPQIQFNDYFYLDFPEKWCIEVTQDNYKELDVWMHRNWKNYENYTDKWKVCKKSIGHFFSGRTAFGYGGHSYSNLFECEKASCTLITTDQFRGKFGNLKVHDVEFVNQSSDKVAEAINRSLDNDVEKEILSSKAKYYKEKSDRLRCEKWVMSSEIARHKSEIERLKDVFNAITKDNTFQIRKKATLQEEIRQLKNIIAENNVTISKQRQDIEFDGDRIKRLNELLAKQKLEIEEKDQYINILQNDVIANEQLQEENDNLEMANDVLKYKFKKKIKKLKNKVKWLSLR